YLDDAPLEERRTQAVIGRRWLTPEDAADLGRLDPEAIARVRDEAWPAPANADEMHDALGWLRAPGPGRTLHTPRGAGSPRRGPVAWTRGEVGGRRRGAAAIRGRVAAGGARSGDRGAGRLCRARVVGRYGIGRDPAWPARRVGAGVGDGAGGAARSPAQRACR